MVVSVIWFQIITWSMGGNPHFHHKKRFFRVQSIFSHEKTSSNEKNTSPCSAAEQISPPIGELEGVHLQACYCQQTSNCTAQGLQKIPWRFGRPGDVVDDVWLVFFSFLGSENMRVCAFSHFFSLQLLFFWNIVRDTSSFFWTYLLNIAVFFLFLSVFFVKKKGLTSPLKKLDRTWGYKPPGCNRGKWRFRFGSPSLKI